MPAASARLNHFRDWFRRSAKRCQVPVLALRLGIKLVQQVPWLAGIKAAITVFAFDVVAPGVQVVAHLFDSKAPAPAGADFKAAFSEDVTAPFLFANSRRQNRILAHWSD